MNHLVNLPSIFFRVWNPGFWLKTGYGVLYLERREILKRLSNEIIDRFKSLLFAFHTFGVRRSIDVLDPEVKFEPDPGL